MKKTNKKMIKGYKGFSPGMICRGKQYAENTLFYEKEAKICEKGMHFCKHPLAVLAYYPPVENEKISEYAEVEAPCKLLDTDDGIKYCTSKLHIKSKLTLEELCRAAINWGYARIEDNKDALLCADDGEIAVLSTAEESVSQNKAPDSVAINTGCYSVATNTGDESISIANSYCSSAVVEGRASVAVNTGITSIAASEDCSSVAVNTGVNSIAANADCESVALNTGTCSVAMTRGTASVAIATGYGSAAIVNAGAGIAMALGRKSVAKGALGSWIVCAEWKLRDETYYITNLKAAFVDGEKIKADTCYRLKNGKFIEVEDD